MKLLVLYGTRPEAIKMAPVILEARRRDGVETRVLSTGQHREMLRPVTRLFGVEPDVDLDLMQPGQSLAGLASRAVAGLGAAIAAEQPDVLLVQGDTTTAMCGALAAFYAGVPCGHVEAGLRTGDTHAPWPEEANRRLIGQLALWHFAPTEKARASLEAEGIPSIHHGGHGQARVLVTGNTVIDALYIARERVRAAPPESLDLAAALDWKADAAERRLILITGHRRESFGAPFESFCRGLSRIAADHPETLLVYPAHLNPNVQEPVRRMLSGQDNIRLCAPADYPAFVALMEAADLIITDSGGVQEEAPALGKPVLVTRGVTERPEAVNAGGVKLVGTDADALYENAHHLLTDKAAYQEMARVRTPYGDGRAAGRILDALMS